MTDKKGLFITIEGIDGCGKSTQAHKLCEWLEATGHEILRTFEPGDWEGGPSLRKTLLEGTALTSRTELLLFLADRSGHLDAKISPALRSGRWVVCERYTDSTLAYQSWGRGIAFEEINGLLNWCRFLVPDLTIFLDVDVKTAASRLSRRGRPDRIESGEDGFMARVALGYRELARLNAGRIRTVDAGREVDRVAASIRERVHEYLGEKR